MSFRRLRWMTPLLLFVVALLPAPRAAAQGEIVSIGDAAVVESNSGTTNLVFTISLSSVSSQTVSGVFSTSVGGGFNATGGTSCASAAADFVNVAGQPFSIPPNTLSTTVTVTVCGDVRIADDRTAIWVRWDEATNTFRLCESAGDDPATVECARPAAPGSAEVLQTSSARLHLVGTSVVGSGPTGSDVTLVLDLTFKGGAGGHTYVVAVAAEDDLGNHDDAFLPAGSVEVTGRR